MISWFDPWCCIWFTCLTLHNCKIRVGLLKTSNTRQLEMTYENGNTYKHIIVILFAQPSTILVHYAHGVKSQGLTSKHSGLPMTHMTSPTSRQRAHDVLH